MGLLIENIEYYLPQKIVTNDKLKAENPEWDMEKIFPKTGVLQRHIAETNETAFDLSVKACDKLFAKTDKNTIDTIIYCTQSPDYIMPSNAFLLHKHYNMNESAFSFDFNHACTGYIYGLLMADSFLKSGLASKILLVNADTYSKYINKKDRSTRVLFGDGAAASILSNISEGGIIDKSIITVGKGYRNFWIPAGGARSPKNNNTSKNKKNDLGNIRNMENIYMDGMGVWSFINSTIPNQIFSLLEKNSISINQIDMFVFHQASKMTLDSLTRKMKIPSSKVVTNLMNIGNVVSASIPIALKEGFKRKELNTNQTIIIAGFGVGLSSGVILMEI